MNRKNLTRSLRVLVVGMILMCAAARAEEHLSVLSWNTEHYGWERRSPAERTLLESNMFAVVRAVQPDIFLMQETYGSFERFKAALPGYDARLLGRCNAIFSRFPIVGTHEPYREKNNYGEPQGGAFNTQVADLDAGCMRLRACPVAMLWLPICMRTPADKTPDELLAWENERQPYDAAPRPQAMAGILAGMASFLAEKDEVPILMAGDFNSHSHLDWTAATGSWQGHHGRTVPWPVSSQMVAAGFYDVFRTLYPDPAANYGATVPLPGVLADFPKPFLRLDYIYAAGNRLKPVSFEIIAGDYHRPFVWQGRSFSAFPSDHAAVLARFVVDARGERLRRIPAGIYDAELYSQVRLEDLTEANRATYVADAKAAGVDVVWLSISDFFEEEARRQAILGKLAAEIRNFEAAGFSVGVWINCFGWGNERAYFKDSVKITTLEGKARGGAVCPLDPKLRRALADNVRDIARAGAKFILMDDDYVQSARGLVGCSCPRHLARVAAKCGRQKVTCADVKAAFTGKPNAVRTAYLDVGGEVAMELARELRRTVDAVNPSVGMGLCASYTHWDVEGCDLLELVGAFAGKGRRVLRISGAPYWPNAKLPGTGLADVIEFVRMQSAWTRGLDMTTFDENDPYPRKVAQVPPWRCELYDKAIIADGRLARHKYMLCYGPDRTEPGYLEAHLADMPDDAKLRRIFAGTEPYGVKVECPQHRLRTAELPSPFIGESQIAALYSMPTTAFDLRRKGIPTRFDGPAASDEPLAVTVRAPTPDIYQIVHRDRAKGEYAVLLENMGATAADVKIVAKGDVRILSSLRGKFAVVPGGIVLANLSPHAYAAVRFILKEKE